MKVLKFLVAAEYNKLSTLLVKYLIDCGHFVDIIKDKDSTKWLNFVSHNINIKIVGL
mgnify:CR=1 FL=1